MNLTIIYRKFRKLVSVMLVGAFLVSDPAIAQIARECATLSVESRFAALISEGITPDFQAQFEIIAGTRLLLEGKNYSAVNGMLIEKHGDRIHRGERKIEFLPGAACDRKKRKVKARFKVIGHDDKVFEVEYDASGKVDIEKEESDLSGQRIQKRDEEREEGPEPGLLQKIKTWVQRARLRRFFGKDMLDYAFFVERITKGQSEEEDTDGTRRIRQKIAEKQASLVRRARLINKMMADQLEKIWSVELKTKDLEGQQDEQRISCAAMLKLKQDLLAKEGIDIHIYPMYIKIGGFYEIFFIPQQIVRRHRYSSINGGVETVYARALSDKVRSLRAKPPVGYYQWGANRVIVNDVHRLAGGIVSVLTGGTYFTVNMMRYTPFLKILEPAVTRLIRKDDREADPGILLRSEEFLMELHELKHWQIYMERGWRQPYGSQGGEKDSYNEAFSMLTVMALGPNIYGNLGTILSGAHGQRLSNARYVQVVNIMSEYFDIGLKVAFFEDKEVKPEEEDERTRAEAVFNEIMEMLSEKSENELRQAAVWAYYELGRRIGFDPGPIDAGVISEAIERFRREMGDKVKFTPVRAVRERPEAGTEIDAINIPGVFRDGDIISINMAEEETGQSNSSFTETDRQHMQDLVEYAENGVRAGDLLQELPVVAKLVDAHGNELLRVKRKPYGRERINETGVDAMHAEIMAIREAERRGLTDWSEYTLYVNLLPCSRCMKAIAEFYGLKRVVYGIEDTGLTPGEEGISRRSLRYNGVEVSKCDVPQLRARLLELFSDLRESDKAEPEVSEINKASDRMLISQMGISKEYRAEYRREKGRDIQVIVFDADLWMAEKDRPGLEYLEPLMMKYINFLKHNLNPAKEHILLVAGKEEASLAAKEKILGKGIFSASEMLLYDKDAAKRDILDVPIEEIYGLPDTPQQFIRDHMRRVTAIAVRLGEAMGLPERNMNILRAAAAGHDVGSDIPQGGLIDFDAMGIPSSEMDKNMGEMTYEEFINWANSRKMKKMGEALTQPERDRLTMIYNHGVEFADNLKKYYQLTPEVEILIRGHACYPRFLHELHKRKDEMTIPPEEINELAAIIIVADILESEGNRDKREQRGKDIMPLHEIFKHIDNSFGKRGVEVPRRNGLRQLNRRPRDILKELLVARDEALFDVIREARGADSITDMFTEEEEDFLEELQGQARNKRVEYLEDENRDEKYLLMNAARNMGKNRVNMHIDLSPVPDDTKQLEENMESLAGMIAQQAAYGLDIKYSLFNDKAGLALPILKDKLRSLDNVPGLSASGLIGRVSGLHSGDNVTDVRLEDIKGIDKERMLGEREYVIALKDDPSRAGISMPNYTTAASMGLSLAALRFARDDISNDPEKEKEYRTFRKKVLGRFQEMFKRFGVIGRKSDFSSDELELMITGCSATKIYYAILYALPPAAKDAAERIVRYHDKLQLLLKQA